MSQAPVRRKSRKAVAATIEKNAASQKKPAPAPHLVVLRVKRKRGDAAVESLLVATTDEGERSEEQEVMPNRKRRAAGTTSIAETMAVLSLDKTAESQRQQQHPPLQQQQQQQQPAVRMQPPRRLVYKRVRTTEPDGSRDRGEEGRSPVAGAPPARQKRALDGVEEGGGDGDEGGGRLDALLRSNGLNTNSASCSPPPPTAAVFDYLEVRRVKARAVGIVPRNSPAPADSSERGRHEQHPSPQSSGPAPEGAATAAPANLHVIDLHAVGQADASAMMDTSVMGDAGAAGGAHVATAKRAAAPILTPVERQTDEAIFTAFQTGDMSSLRDILTTSSYPSPAGVNYRRRLGDASTALMAAAFHGDLATVRHLLSLGAKATLVDAHGRSAALFAGMRGHRECFAELQRVVDQEEEEARVRSSKRRSSGGGGGGGGGAGGDFVYDLYYYEPPAQASTVGPPVVGAPAPAPGAGAGAPSAAVATSCGKLGETTTIDAADGGAPPVVRLSGIGPIDENAVGTMAAGVELEFEHDSDWSGLGEEGDDGEDPDSNSEGYYGNDYPEDEGDEEGAGISPYVYAGGSGSSCASENESSSNDGNAGFDSDSDNEPYYRKVVDVHEEFSRNFGSGGGGGDGGGGGLADEEDNDDFDGVSGLSAGGSGSGVVGVDGLVKRIPPTSGRGDGRDGASGISAESAFHAGLGEAGVFARGPER